MINIMDVRTDCVTTQGVFADLYNVVGAIPYLIGRTYIRPYRDEMKKDVNNITLFLDADNNIFSGQICKYNWNKGLHIVEFIEEV